ncbi:type 1 fimbrial protein [Salmonella enterica subsp. enterica serovar Give]|nr:type 1 fimbrial protein [Salmonella enterica subsp. enterica serovar Give]EED4548477.1 type 1 fimbrial protein [Salmonella enterica subsp. enterica serovar Give]
MHKPLLAGCFALAGFLLLPPAQAQLDCVIDRPVFSKNIQLPGTGFTVGSDLPVGAVLYTGYISKMSDPGGSSAMTCRYNKGEAFVFENYSLLKGGGGDTGNGIYATSLPGVGVRVKNYVNGDINTPLTKNRTVLLASENYPNTFCDKNSTSCNMTSNAGFHFELVKTGEIGAGQINGGSFPQISVIAYSPTPGAKVDRGEIATVTFSGSLNVKAASCRTPGDYEVYLGDYTTRDISSKKFTPWVDASIQLTGCPRFTGMPGGNDTTWLYPDSQPATVGRTQANLLEVTLTPLTTVHNASEGTFEIESGPGSARGVDIQLRKGTREDNSQLILNQPYSIYLANDGRPTLTVPLVARYLSNGDSLSPGRATGKVTYLINYK